MQPLPAVKDSVKGHWSERYAPIAALPYIRMARLERPIGWWLLLLPCWWSLFLADLVERNFPSLWEAALFMIGAIVMRGAGCVWNDIADRDIDAKVERTKLRPLPSGQISLKQAIAFGLSLSMVGLIILLQFNGFSIMLGFASLIIVAIYPFMKRITFWPQATLGLAFSWGALMGWATIFGVISVTSLFLYAGSICWVIGYDTIYAHQDRENDMLVNIGSTALLFAENTRYWLGLFYGLAIILLLIALYSTQASLFSYIGLLAFASHLIWQIYRLDIHSSDTCLMLFRSNRNAGLLLTLGLLAETFLIYFSFER